MLFSWDSLSLTRLPSNTDPRDARRRCSCSWTRTPAKRMPQSRSAMLTEQQWKDQSRRLTVLGMTRCRSSKAIRLAQATVQWRRMRLAGWDLQPCRLAGLCQEVGRCHQRWVVCRRLHRDSERGHCQAAQDLRQAAILTTGHPAQNLKQPAILTTSQLAHRQSPTDQNRHSPQEVKQAATLTFFQLQLARRPSAQDLRLAATLSI